MRELLAAGKRAVHEVWLIEGSDPAPILGEIDNLARKNHVPVRMVSPRKLESVQRTETPQGVVAFADPLESWDLMTLVMGPEQAQPAFVPSPPEEGDGTTSDLDGGHGASSDPMDAAPVAFGVAAEIDTPPGSETGSAAAGEVGLGDERSDVDDGTDLDLEGDVDLGDEAKLDLDDGTALDLDLEGNLDLGDLDLGDLDLGDDDLDEEIDLEIDLDDETIDGDQAVQAAPMRKASVPTASLPKGPAVFLVVVDGVTDPHNLGAILRSAECAGATGVVLPRHRAVHVTAAVAKAAAGAVEHLPIALVAGIPSALQDLERLGVRTVGLDERGDVSVFDLNVGDGPIALVLGAEGRGLSPLSRRRCDQLANIPLHGEIPSLNVSTAAAVACFEVARGRARAS